MKRLLILLGLMLLLPNFGFAHKDFWYELTVNIKNANGQILCLYIPSDGLDASPRAKVVNGKAVFKGTSGQIESAQLRVEADMEKSIYSSPIVFIEPGKSVISIDAKARKEFLDIGKITVNWGEVNLEYDVAKKSFYSIPVLISGNEKTRDSLMANSYPTVRKTYLEKYETEIRNSKFDAIKLEFLSHILGLSGEGNPFQADQLSGEQKKSLRTLFSEINKNAVKQFTYAEILHQLEKIEKAEFIRKFKDFELVDTNGKKVKFSEVVKNNKFTVLDFWWTGCGPCRELNQETAKIYQDLKKAGIEIVSVNVDESESRWKSSSARDGIANINLYAGKTSTIESDYDVTFFPTKIVFDQQFHIIDFKFKQAEELFGLQKK